jgi:hypothetical protein
MNMDAFYDNDYQLIIVKRKSGESDEHLAERLYHTQRTVQAGNASRDLIPNDPSDPFQFGNLSSEIRDEWIEMAKKYK